MGGIDVSQLITSIAFLYWTADVSNHRICEAQFISLGPLLLTGFPNKETLDSFVEDRKADGMGYASTLKFPHVQGTGAQDGGYVNFLLYMNSWAITLQVLSSKMP